MTSTMVKISGVTPRHIHMREPLLSDVKVAFVFFNLGVDCFRPRLALYSA